MDFYILWSPIILNVKIGGRKSELMNMKSFVLSRKVFKFAVKCDTIVSKSGK